MLIKVRFKDVRTRFDFKGLFFAYTQEIEISHSEILAKTRCRMTTVITFSRQSEVGSRLCTDGL